MRTVYWLHFPSVPFAEEEEEDRLLRGKYLGLLARMGDEATFWLAEELHTTKEVVRDSVLLEPKWPGLAVWVREKILDHPKLAHLHLQVGVGMEAEEALVVENFGLVQEVVFKKGWGRSLPLEDRLALGIAALHRAAQSYEPSKGAFSTYATQWLRAYLLREGERQERTLGAEVSLDAEAYPSEEGGEPTAYRDLLADPRSTPEAAIDRVLVERGLAVLNQREREVLLRHYGFYGQEETLREIGEDLGVSRQRVQQIESKAIEKIREFLLG